jgi:hypothetical protein
LVGFVAKAAEPFEKLSTGAVRREERGDVFTRGITFSEDRFVEAFSAF